MSNEASQKPYSPGDISTRFKDYIEKQKLGLKRFYKWETEDEYNSTLKDPVNRGVVMTQKLMANGCPREVAGMLSILALYDLAMLIDNSLSMGIDEEGARVKTLASTLGATSTVYSFAEPKGITAIRFLNTANKYFNVTPGKINALMKKIVFEGLTNIGTKLRDKILVNHVKSDMKKPLLVIVITDAEIEGETTGLLKDVIMSQAVELEKEHGRKGPQAVAYQFAKIGNDGDGQSLVQDLDDDKRLGEYIDSMGAEHRLEDLQKRMWDILPKLLLGPISSWWDGEATLSDEALQNRELGSGESGDELDDDDLEEEAVDNSYLTTRSTTENLSTDFSTLGISSPTSHTNSFPLNEGVGPREVTV